MVLAPAILLRTPERPLAPMDALSDVLRVIRLKGGVFLHAEFTAPWCILSRIGPEDCGSLLKGAEHLVLYHYVVEGRLAAQIPGEKPVEITAGEVVIFPHNHEHLLGSSLDLPPLLADELVRASAPVCRRSVMAGVARGPASSAAFSAATGSPATPLWILCQRSY